VAEKTQKELIRELYQAVIGIPENPDENGLIGDMKTLHTKLDLVNGRGRKNEVRSKINRWAIVFILGGGGVLSGIGKLLNWF